MTQALSVADIKTHLLSNFTNMQSDVGDDFAQMLYDVFGDMAITGTCPGGGGPLAGGAISITKVAIKTRITNNFSGIENDPADDFAQMLTEVSTPDTTVTGTCPDPGPLANGAFSNTKVAIKTRITNNFSGIENDPADDFAQALFDIWSDVLVNGTCPAGGGALIGGAVALE